MKKLIRSITFTALILCLLALTGCGKKSTGVTVSPADLAKQLATETVTSDTLTETSADILLSNAKMLPIPPMSRSFLNSVFPTRPLCTLPTMQKRPKN